MRSVVSEWTGIAQCRMYHHHQLLPSYGFQLYRLWWSEHECMLSSRISNFWFLITIYVSFISMRWWFGSHKFAIVHCGCKCKLRIQRTVRNENENVNKTKSDVIYVPTIAYQYILSVHCSWPPENNRSILRDVHITMEQSDHIDINPLKIDEFMKSISHKRFMRTGIRIVHFRWIALWTKPLEMCNVCSDRYWMHESKMGSHLSAHFSGCMLHWSTE